MQQRPGIIFKLLKLKLVGFEFVPKTRKQITEAVLRSIPEFRLLNTSKKMPANQKPMHDLLKELGAPNRVLSFFSSTQKIQMNEQKSLKYSI